jgi:endonuclease/exonuclease/phosphatase family metal-dependent hydrolase
LDIVFFVESSVQPLRRAACGAALGIALVSGGCGPATNLLNLSGPRFVGAYAPAQTGSDRIEAPIRVVTFNIKYSIEIDRAIEVLEGDSLREADVVALQEMDENGVDRIARALRLNYAYYPASIHHSHHRYFGPAILSRWPIERSWKVLLPHKAWGRGQRRTATAAVVRVNGRPLLVYAVHLETMVKLSDEKRWDQARTVIADAERFQGPVVLAGDFNSYGIGARMRREGWDWTTRWVGPTVSVLSLDHIFTRGLVPAEPFSVGAVRRVNGASDHRPVWAVLVPGYPATAAAPATAAIRTSTEFGR